MIIFDNPDEAPNVTWEDTKYIG